MALQRQTFTVRLPLTVTRPVMRALRRRARSDGSLVDFVTDSLTQEKINASDSAVMDAAKAAADKFAHSSGCDGEWVSERWGAVVRAVADYRAAYKSLRHFGDPITTESLRRYIAAKGRTVDAYALVNRKMAFTPTWDDLEPRVLGLIATGDHTIEADVLNIGHIVIHGAGKRTLGEDAHVQRLHLEVRGDRAYLSVVVQHRVNVDNVPTNRGYVGTIDVALTPTCFAADSAGVAMTHLRNESRALRALMKERSVTAPGSARENRRARRLMNARNNLARQFAARVVDQALANNKAVRLVCDERGSAEHPRYLGMHKKLRRMTVGYIFERCRAKGVVFISEPTDRQMPLTQCEHADEVCVGFVLGSTVVAMCPTCAQSGGL